MKAKDSIHELIKSLTKSEKRYFKLMSSRHTIGDENNYILLFDFIEKQTEYDEEVLFKAFKGQAFLNKFSITKKRLYDHILNSLDLFHSSSSIDAQIFKQLHSADILYNKSLYDQCRTILRSAEKLAEKHNRFNLLLEISKKQKRLHENKGYAEISAVEILSILERDNYLQDQSFTYNKLWNIKSQLFHLLSHKGVSRTQEDILNFKSIIDDLTQSVNQEIFYFDTHYLFHHIYSAYYFAINDFENCLAHLKINIEYFENDLQHIENHPNSYFSILTNAIFVSEKQEKYKEANELLEKLKQLPAKIEMDSNEDLQIKLFSSINSIELSMLTRRGDFEKALKLVPLIERGLMTYGANLSAPRIAFLEFKMAVIFLSLGEFSSALKWINNILNNKRLDQKEDLFSFAQLLDLLIHLEMKNKQLLPYALKNTQRYLKSHNRVFSFEKMFLQLISKIIKSDDVFDKEAVWEELYSSLKTIEGDAMDSVALEYFDFQSWAESKFKRIPFTKIVSEKFNNKFSVTTR
jgi:hypothetical protein